MKGADGRKKVGGLCFLVCMYCYKTTTTSLIRGESQTEHIISKLSALFAWLLLN